MDLACGGSWLPPHYEMPPHHQSSEAQLFDELLLRVQSAKHRGLLLGHASVRLLPWSALAATTPSAAAASPSGGNGVTDDDPLEHDAHRRRARREEAMMKRDPDAANRTDDLMHIRDSATVFYSRCATDARMPCAAAGNHDDDVSSVNGAFQVMGIRK